ncbi:MAG: AAA family ATPase, partial [Ignavibacteriae bacterium]|nr:AAA family ATPase [Ignavibacteriota bacterium]
MIEALKDEIDHIKKRRHEVILFDGVLVNDVAAEFIYRFEIPEGTYLSMVEEIEIYVNGKSGIKLAGEIVSIANQFALIKLSSNQGKTISQLTIVWDSDAIPRKLMERLQLIVKNVKEFSLAVTDQLFYPNSQANTTSWKKTLILPSKTFNTDPPKEFQVNERQQEALRKSLNNKVTYLWGPPGTGKTQTLGMIAYNLIRGGKRILFASNTNRAVDIGVLSVIDRYKEHGGDYLKELTRYGQIALFDNNDLRSVAFGRQIETLREAKRAKMRAKIEILDNYRQLKVKLGQFKMQLDRIDNLQKERSKKQGELDSILKELKTLRPQIDNFDNAGFVETIKRKFSGITKLNLEAKFKQLQEQGRKLKLLIDKNNEEQESIEKSYNGLVSMKQEYSVLKKKVDELGGEEALTQEIEKELHVDLEQILREKKFVASTLAKLVMNDVFWRVRYDAILIDEASMVNLPYLSALSALSTQKVIIVGDPQQLLPISLSDNSQTRSWLQRD